MEGNRNDDSNQKCNDDSPRSNPSNDVTTTDQSVEIDQPTPDQIPSKTNDIPSENGFTEITEDQSTVDNTSEVPPTRPNELLDTSLQSGASSGREGDAAHKQTSQGKIIIEIDHEIEGSN